MQNKKNSSAGWIIVLFAAALVFTSCPNEQPNHPQLRYAHIYIKGDANVTITGSGLSGDKGVKWSQLKEKAEEAVSFSPDYELKEWRFDSAEGQLVPADFAFTGKHTLFVVSAPTLFVINENGIITGPKGALADLPVNLAFPVKIGKQFVKGIGEKAFQDAKHLVSLDFTAATRLESINQFAFCNWAGGLYSLERVNLSTCSKLSTIGYAAFQNCKKLKTVDISGCTGLKTIDSSAFSGCEVLPSFDFSSLANLEFMGKHVFRNCYALAEADLSSLKLTSLPTGLFNSCYGLKKVVLPASLKELQTGDYTGVFSGCSALEALDLSRCSELTFMGDNAFEGCSALAQVDLSPCSKLTTIGKSAFAFCSELVSLDLSSLSKLKEIQEKAFASCTKAQVKLPSSVTTFGSEAFGKNGYPVNFCKAVLIPSASDATMRPLIITTGYEESRIQNY